MRIHLAAMGLAILLASPALAADQGKFVSLLDGKTLTGWEGSPRLYRVQDGAIVAGTLKQRIGHNEFLCTTKQFADFELRLQAKIIGQGRNAGVQFRSQRIPNHHEVKGYQCDIGFGKGRFIWGSLYDESRRRKVLAEGDNQKLGKLVRPNDWNELVIRAQGKRIQIWVNGYQTVDYTELDEKIPQRGIIGLQIHGGPPSEAWYKNIVIKEIRK